MVCYVILRQFLREILPKISLRNTYISAWLIPRRGYLRGVNIPDATSWINFPMYTQFIDDAHHTEPVSDDYKLDFGSDDKSDWPDDGAEDENNEASHDSQNFSQIADTNHNPPWHDTEPTKTRKPNLSDTCLFIWSIISQNTNGLGVRNEDKLEKIISPMIDRNINDYCLQETWKICNYMLTIRGYTVFHHGMNEKTQQQGRISAGVMIIISPELTRVWTQAGKLKPITSPPTSKTSGRTIGITLIFPNKLNRSTDTYHQKAKGNTKIFLCSIYHPHEIDENKEFLDEINQLITNWSRNSEILMGADINLQCWRHVKII